jgi:hypothetical protein
MFSSPSLKIEAAHFSDPSVLIYHTTCHHISEILTPVLLHGSGCLYNQQHDTVAFCRKTLLRVVAGFITALSEMQ